MCTVDDLWMQWQDRVFVRRFVHDWFTGAVVYQAIVETSADLSAEIIRS